MYEDEGNPRLLTKAKLWQLQRNEFILNAIPCPF